MKSNDFNEEKAITLTFLTKNEIFQTKMVATTSTTTSSATGVN